MAHSELHDPCGKDGGRGEISRRDFLKLSALSAAWLMLDGGILSSITGCTAPADWNPLSFPRVLLHNFRLFDGINGFLQRDRMLLIGEGAIEAVEHTGDLSQYGNYRIIDLKGMTLMPGMIDNHVHISVPFTFDVTPQAILQMNRQIANNVKSCVMSGVTTVRDVGGFPQKILKCRDMIDRMEIPGPRIISSLSPIAAREDDILGAPSNAPYFTNPAMKWFLGGNYAERPTGPAQIEEACLRMIELGAQWLKTLQQDHDYSFMRRPLPNHSDEGYRKILEIGERHGIKCALHEPFVSGFIKGVELGYHTLEHMPLDRVIDSRVIDAFIVKGMAILPTILVYNDHLREEALLEMVRERGNQFLTQEAHRQSILYLGRSIDKTRRELTESASGKHTDSAYMRGLLPIQVANLRKIHRMGGTVGIGTDNGGSFCSYFGRYADELRHFVNDAGISTADTLRMATSVNARILGMNHLLGTVERGKRADLIAVEGNPLENISTLDRVSLVIKDGTIIKGGELINVV